jgi:hypothetical protein
MLGRQEAGIKPRTNRLPAKVEGYLQKCLQTHFGAADLRSNAPLFATILRLQKLASSVATDEFESQLNAVLPSPQMPATATELVEHLANAFCPAFAGVESELLKKSLQEALLTSIDLQGDASVPEFRELLQRFLRRHGMVGLVRLFVRLHMFNMVWFELRQSDAMPRRSEQALAAFISAVERVCHAKANAAVRRIIE